MPTLRYRPGDVIEPLALFPLPEVVLFPGALLPLYVFEPRYRAMTEHVLCGSRQLSVVLTTGRALGDSPPTLARVGGLGEVIEHTRLPDGRFDLVLLGRARVELEELPFVAPYRRARARVLDDGRGFASEAEIDALLFSVAHFVAAARRHGPSFDVELPTRAEPAALCDACAHRLIIDGDDRQRLLETLDVGARLRLCAELLAVQTAGLAERGPPS